MAKTFLQAKDAIDFLGISAPTFYRLVKNGKIQKHYPTPFSKHGEYDADELAGLRSQFMPRAGEEPKGGTDWVQDSDMGNMYNLEYAVYGEETGNPSIIRKWYKRNPYVCRVLFNESDRRDFWGAINMLPLSEATIYKLLKKEMRDIDINPEKEILTFDKPGVFDFYVASVIIRPDKPNSFGQLLNSVFSFWCERAPEQQIGKIFGRVVSEDGEMMARKLFFSPLWTISDEAFVLDMSRPNPSKIVQSFQYCVKSRMADETRS
ncbi:MAG: helix-turn-helix domain-containing protein [Ktedonobacteraceae bacterium]|nr:helix-turn-helix domain-containing protein [Ktedonobacteraceae bacterium]MBA3825037.1 helix-turn-helix domain-containing protein [Ktedonobacterales bacterium]